MHGIEKNRQEKYSKTRPNKQSCLEGVFSKKEGSSSSHIINQCKSLIHNRVTGIKLNGFKRDDFKIK